MTWSPAQYLQFEADRTRPVRDLLAAIPPMDAGSVVDLGCGPGNSTELLAARYPNARTEGVDNSGEMLEDARRRLPGHTFIEADIASWQPSTPPDVILANAVLQWLPDHAVLLPRLLGLLAPGGSLAVQVPDNLEEPAQRMMRDVAAEQPWADRLTQAAGQRTRLPTPAEYYGILRASATRVDVWRTTYMHVLPGGPDAIVEWFKGSGLRPFLAPLTPDEKVEYLERYRERIAATHPTQRDGSVLLPFPRLFFVATR